MASHPDSLAVAFFPFFPSTCRPREPRRIVLLDVTDRRAPRRGVALVQTFRSPCVWPSRSDAAEEVIACAIMASSLHPRNARVEIHARCSSGRCARKWLRSKVSGGLLRNCGVAGDGISRGSLQRGSYKRHARSCACLTAARKGNRAAACLSTAPSIHQSFYRPVPSLPQRCWSGRAYPASSAASLSRSENQRRRPRSAPRAKLMGRCRT